VRTCYLRVPPRGGGYVIERCTTLDPTRGSGRVGLGRVRKITGKSGSGRVQFGQKLKLNFTLKCFCICILFCIFVCTTFQLYIQFSVCSFQCILGDVTEGEFLSATASRWHDCLYLLAGSAISAAISVVDRLSYDTIRYDSVYLTCSKKLTGSQLSPPYGTNSLTHSLLRLTS